MTEHDKRKLALWDETHEKQLEDILENNAELRKVFETHPERKNLYKLKILDSEITEAPSPPENIYCKSCIFQLPPISIDGTMTSRCNWGRCKILDEKPYDVLYKGAKCEYYEREKRKK